MKEKVSLSLLLCIVALAAHAQVKELSFGRNKHFRYDLRKGTYDLIFNGRVVVKDAYAVCREGDRMDSSTSYTSRRWSVIRREGHKIYSVTLTAPGRPEMNQAFFVDKKQGIFGTEVWLKSAGSNYMSPLTSEQVDINEPGDEQGVAGAF